MENEEIKIKEEYQKDLKFIENEFKYKVLEQEKEQTSSWIKKILMMIWKDNWKEK